MMNQEGGEDVGVSVEASVGEEVVLVVEEVGVGEAEVGRVVVVDSEVEEVDFR